MQPGGLVYAISARRLVRRLGQRRMVLAGGWLMGLGYLMWRISPMTRPPSVSPRTYPAEGNDRAGLFSARA